MAPRRPPYDRKSFIFAIWSAVRFASAFRTYAARPLDAKGLLAGSSASGARSPVWPLGQSVSQ